MINSLRYPEFTVEFWFSRVSISEVKVTFLRGEVCSTVHLAALGVVMLVRLHVSHEICVSLRSTELWLWEVACGRRETIAMEYQYTGALVTSN